MVAKKSPPKIPGLAGRIAHVKQVCGFPSDVAYAAAIGTSTQALGNWIKRESMSTDSLAKFSAGTGASIDWLVSGRGEPFPTGPIVYAGPTLSGAEAMQRLADAENQIDVLASVAAMLIQAIGRLAPVEAAAVAAQLRKPLAVPGYAPEALPKLLRVAEEAAAYGAHAAGEDQRKKRK